MARMQFRQIIIERTLIALWCLAIGGAGLWLLAGSFGYWVSAGWLQKDVASLVQAIGSIGAILVAIWVVDRQKKHRERADRQANKDAARKLLAIADLVVPRVHTACLIHKGAPESVIGRVASSMVNSAHTVMNVRVSDTPSADIAQVWFELVGCVIGIQEDVAKLAGHEADDGLAKFGLQAGEHTIQEIHGRLKELVDSYEG